MHRPSCFDHEKLDGYRLAIEFLSWTGELLDGPLSGTRYAAVKHLDDASQSIADNIAEGNGKRSLLDRCRVLDVARGSALGDQQENSEYEYEHEHEYGGKEKQSV